MNSHEVFIHIHQGCFAGIGAIVRLPQCQWSKPDGYGKISQCITTTKHSKAKTVCIFLGIYCMYGSRSYFHVEVEKNVNVFMKIIIVVRFYFGGRFENIVYINICQPNWASQLCCTCFIIGRYEFIIDQITPMVRVVDSHNTEVNINPVLSFDLYGHTAHF